MTRVLHIGARSPRRDSRVAVDIDLIRELSHRIETERKPGETQHAALMRLRREVGA